MGFFCFVLSFFVSLFLFVCMWLILVFKARLRLETFCQYQCTMLDSIAKEHRLLAANGVLVLLGTSNFQTTTTIEPAIDNTKGQSRQTAESNQGYSIAYAFGKRREVHIAREKEAHIPAGSERHLEQQGW